MWIAIEEHPWFIDELTAAIDKVDDGFRVAISAPGRQIQFSVEDLGSDVGFTPFAAPEDFAFGLWVAQIINSSERQDVLLEMLVDAKLDEVPEHSEIDEASGSVDLRHRWRQSERHPARDPRKGQSPG